MPNSKSAHTRKRLYINPNIQGGLIARTMFHWLLYMATALIAVTIWTAYCNHRASILTLAQEVFSNFAPAFFAGVVLLPLFLYDQLRFSHRMVGPIYRLQQEMRKLTGGEGVQRLRFRQHDHWPELAEEFNRLAEMVVNNRRLLRDTEQQMEEMVNENLTKTERRLLQQRN